MAFWDRNAHRGPLEPNQSHSQKACLVHDLSFYRVPSTSAHAFAGAPVCEVILFTARKEVPAAKLARRI